MHPMGLPEKKPALDGPLGEAVEIIEKLLALCSEHGLKREAYSIVIGREIPKRQRGAPLVKGPRYRRELAFLLEIEALGPKGRRGARTRVAQLLAKIEVRDQNRSPAWRSEVMQRTRSYQNDLSKLSPEDTIEAAYYMRRKMTGESFEKAKARLDAAMAGDKVAEREVFEIVRDLPPNLTKIREK
jgi:hypothetical protein